MQTLEQIVLLTCVDTFQNNSAEVLQHCRSPELQRIALNSDWNGLHQVPMLSPVQDGGATLYDVDIVTVNSLSGDLYKTWACDRSTTNNEEILWLSHLLPHDLLGT